MPTPMDGKQGTLEALAFALPGGGVLALEGPDASAFAQAQFMNDVRPLADGEWQWSGVLSPKGRLIALFALLRVDADHWWLLLHDTPPATLRDHLERFRFRSKLQVRVRDDLHLAGAFDAAGLDGTGLDGTGLGRVAGRTPAAEAALDLAGTGRQLLVLDAAPPADPDRFARWRLADLRLGIPWLDASLRDRYTPQMLGLDQLAAYSVRKGCYPGQEIVARTHFLGQARRGPVRLRVATAPGVDAPDVDAAVEADGREIGRVVFAAAANGEAEAFAVATLPLPEVALACAGEAVVPLDFERSPTTAER